MARNLHGADHMTAPFLLALAAVGLMLLSLVVRRNQWALFVVGGVLLAVAVIIGGIPHA